MNNDSYKLKYLKYKEKYLELKEMNAGMNPVEVNMIEKKIFKVLYINLSLILLRSL